MTDESMFNKEILDFRYFSKSALLTEELIKKYESLPSSKKKLYMIRFLFDGLRLDDSGDGCFVCVMCDYKFAESDDVNVHIAEKHNDPGQLLRNSKYGPVVGLDQMIESRNHEDEVIEYECNCCSLFLQPKMAFWHGLSYAHKEQFFKLKYPDDSVNQIVDNALRHQKIDEALLDHEKKHGRGEFVAKLFEPGMIASSQSYHSKLNMSYIRKLYPTESAKLELIYQKEEQVINPLRTNLDLNIQNEEQFKQGKEILQKMNQALLDYLK